MEDFTTLDFNSLDTDFETLIPELEDESDIKEEKVAKPTRRKVTRNYINNNDFLQALIQYKEDCAVALQQNKPKPRIPNYIGECFMKLAEGLARRPNFFGYSYRDEMISDGIENCLMYFENFDTTRKNPFAYFTSILWWCFVRRIKKEKKEQYIKYKATENFGILDEAELLELGDGQIKQLEVYENMYDFIKKFEETELKKTSDTKSKSKTKNRPVSGIELFLED